MRVRVRVRVRIKLGVRVVSNYMYLRVGIGGYGISQTDSGDDSRAAFEMYMRFALGIPSKPAVYWLNMAHGQRAGDIPPSEANA